MGRKRVFSGIRPTGPIHLGNYLGAIKSWIQLQDRYECIYAIVDYHGMTTPYHPAEMRANVRELLIDYLAAGVDPERSILMVQSAVPEHTELAWILGTVTPIAWLERVPTFKEKAEQHPDYVHLGLLSYGVLMAADIVLYKAEVVPVGEDQLPHLELTREIVRRFHHLFGVRIFPEPQALVPQDTARIMSLTDPEKKMSKTLGPRSLIALSDPPEAIREKIMKAVTDTGPSGERMSPGVANLFQLLKIFGTEEEYRSLRAEYDAGTLRYVNLKRTLADAIIRSLEPFRRRRAELENDPVYLDRVLRDGIRRARAIARETMAEVKEACGLLRDEPGLGEAGLAAAAGSKAAGGKAPEAVERR
ncbi:MAG: tryptophan--tRNA ligase [Bacillota bacterium]|nr:MAG: tryptophan--tRNA ligase [Bacillota bacterium]